MVELKTVKSNNNKQTVNYSTTSFIQFIMKREERGKIMNKKNKTYGLISQEVMNSDELSQKAKLLYSMLVSFAGNKDKAFPSQKLLAERLGMSKSTVNRAIKELEDNEIIKIVKQQNANGFKTNIYIIQDGLPRIKVDMPRVV